MRHERFIPMEYANEQLMDDLNNWCIALKVALYQEQLGALNHRYPKPTIQEIDQMVSRMKAKESAELAAIYLC
jgi:hypothetical protein